MLIYDRSILNRSEVLVIAAGLGLVVGLGLAPQP